MRARICAKIFCNDLPLAVAERLLVLGHGDAGPGAREAEDLLRHLGHGEHEVDEAGGDGALGHPVVLGFVGVLHDGEAALLLDLLDAERAVRPRPGKDDADRVPVVGAGEGAEEVVDGGALDAPLLQLGKAEVGVDGVEVLPRRDNVDAVRLQRGLVRHLHDGHLHVRLEKVGEVALMLGREVHHDDEGQPVLLRHVGKERLEGFQPPRRGPNADDRRAVCLFGRLHFNVRFKALLLRFHTAFLCVEGCKLLACACPVRLV